MKPGLRWLVVAGVAAATAVLSPSVLRCETIKLELKRLADRSASEPQDFVFRVVSPQYFFLNFGDQRRSSIVRKAEEADFRRLVHKEPAKYNLKEPLRRVAKLGGKEYAFVLDAKSADSPQYDRLYFDLNRNGDLTDDKPIDARPRGLFSGGLAEFPRVDLTLDVEGTKCDYSFFVRVYSAYSRVTKDVAYVSVALTAAAYREGKITLDGKPRRIALLDFDSNGRFDDLIKVHAEVAAPGEPIVPETGDLLVLDPGETADNAYAVTESKNRHYLSKLVNLDGHFFQVKVTPAGDTLTLTPLAAPMGKVATPFDQCRAVLSSDLGVVSICAEKDHPALLPEGQWRLLAYTIQQTAAVPPKQQAQPDSGKSSKPQPKTEAAKKPPPVERSLLGALARAFGIASDDEGSSVSVNRALRVSAAGSMNTPVLKVTKNATARLSIGPPYKPVVRVQFRKDKDHVNLGLTLVGVGGEMCTDMNIRGNRPARPQLTITTPDGKVVERGSFEYG